VTDRGIDERFTDFLLWEATTRDVLDFKMAYVDMTGDIMAGLLLSQIVFWHLPNKNGDTKLRVQHDGLLWLAKSRSDWWDEIRLTPRQVDRALGILIEKGLVVTALYKFAGAPTTHIRLENRSLYLGLEPDRQGSPPDFTKWSIGFHRFVKSNLTNR